MCVGAVGGWGSGGFVHYRVSELERHIKIILKIICRENLMGVIGGRGGGRERHKNSIALAVRKGMESVLINRVLQLNWFGPFDVQGGERTVPLILEKGGGGVIWTGLMVLCSDVLPSVGGLSCCLPVPLAPLTPDLLACLTPSSWFCRRCLLTHF